MPMPTDRIRVLRVTKTQTRKPGLQQYHVAGVYADGRKGSWVANTLDAWMASLCERSDIVQVVWKDGRYGKEIVWVELPV